MRTEPRRQLLNQLIDDLSALSRRSRAGQSLIAAVTDIAHENLHSTFRPIALASLRGESLTRAIHNLPGKSPDEFLVRFVLDSAAERGGDVADQIDALVDSLIERRDEIDDRRAFAATALASTRLLTLLPFATLTLFALSDRRIFHTILQTPAGLTCLTVGIALNGLGRLWTTKIITAP